ncbi:MAG: RraA family protein [Gaiellales bacterium]
MSGGDRRDGDVLLATCRDVLTVALVCDALDGLDVRQQAMSPTIRPIQPGTRLVGRARTVEVRATASIPASPYAGEMAAIEALQDGDVPVYRVENNVRAALFGELFGLAARSRGAVGAIVDGFVRDVRQLRDLAYPVFARGVSPYDTLGRAEAVAHDVPVVCGGVPVTSGDLIVADDDGVVVVPQAHVRAVVDTVTEKVTKERGARNDLLDGATVREVWNTWHVF